MDKLEPLIKHRFWIIFGLSLPITLFAYYSANGKMADATTQQETMLDGKLAGVPTGVTEPNETFSQEAGEINAGFEKRFNAQVQVLWESQIDRMTWPKIVVDYVPTEYRATIDPEGCYLYARVYPGVIERLWQRVEPYVGDKQSNPALASVDVTWKQKTLVDGGIIPHAIFDKSLPAKSSDVWDAQEDVWLMELIFDAVVRTNEDAPYVSEAPLRQINEIKLMGGSGVSSVAPTDSGGGGGYGDDDAFGGSEDDYGGEDDGGFGSGGASAQIAFSVAEEFGPQQPEESEGDSGQGNYGGSGGGDEADGATEDYGGGGRGRGKKMKRYIGESSLEQGPYRERGFYMSVLILQDSIPSFLSELSMSPWPIRIGRFHIGANPHAPKAPTGGSRFGNMAFGGGGFGGGSYGEDADDSYGGGGGFGGGGFGGGGFGMGATALELPAYMKLTTSIDPSLRSNPNLVQMDLCGVITMYNPQTDDSVEVVDDGSTEEDFTEVLENSAATPEEAAAQAAAEGESGAPAGPTFGTPPATPVPAGQAPAGGPPVPAENPPGAAEPDEPTPPAATDATGQ